MEDKDKTRRGKKPYALFMCLLFIQQALLGTYYVLDITGYCWVTKMKGICPRLKFSTKKMLHKYFFVTQKKCNIKYSQGIIRQTNKIILISIRFHLNVC